VVIPLHQADPQTLLTRPPLAGKVASYFPLPLDLHVLGLPPAFNLSHDQTLQFKICLICYPRVAMLKDYFLQICIRTEVQMCTALVTLQDFDISSACRNRLDIVLRVPTQIV
ncbi:hypothetical protein, partial [Yersinia ruckeri]